MSPADLISDCHAALKRLYDVDPEILWRGRYGLSGGPADSIRELLSTLNDAANRLPVTDPPPIPPGLAELYAGGLTTREGLAMAINYVKRLLAWASVLTKPAAPDEEYVLVSELWQDRTEFKRPSDVTKFLDKIPNEPAPTGIRNVRKGQRRFVHETDWHRFFREKARRESELLEGTALQGQIADIEARKALERERKNRRSN